MAINIDHSSLGNATLTSENSNFTGSYIFPNPNNNNDNYLLISGDSIDKISGLSQCLSGINYNINYVSGLVSQSNAFLIGGGCYSAIQNVGNVSGNLTCSDYSIAIGSGVKTTHQFEFAQAAGYFNCIGDAQSSKIISKMVTTGNQLCTINYLNIPDNSFLSYSNTVIGKTITSQANVSYNAAFKIDGSILKTGSCIELGPMSCSIFSNTEDKYFLIAVADNLNCTVIFQVSGDADLQMNWISDVRLNKIIVA
jgi:hypothetical protein